MATCTYNLILYLSFSYGALDAKVASSSSFPSLNFLAVAGPPHAGDSDNGNSLAPFKWSTTDIDGVPDFKPIDTFDFGPVNHTWVMNTEDNASGAAGVTR